MARVEHPWDTWIKDRMSPTGEITTRVKTVRGETMLVVPRKRTRNAWGEKLLTLDCTNCPLKISNDQAEKITHMLYSQRRAVITFPHEIQGICMVGLATNKQVERTVPVFLVDIPGHIPDACNVRDKIQERSDRLRSIGELKNE